MKRHTSKRWYLANWMMGWVYLAQAILTIFSCGLIKVYLPLKAAKRFARAGWYDQPTLKEVKDVHS